MADRLRDRHLRHARVGRLDRARGAAAVARGGVLVVALLGAGDDAVSARLGDALDARRRALPSRFDLARGGAAVAGHGVAVIAGLSAIDLAVSAHEGRDAGRVRGRADVAGLELAARAAAVSRRGVAVVATLAEVHDAVPATAGAASISLAGPRREHHAAVDREPGVRARIEARRRVDVLRAVGIAGVVGARPRVDLEVERCGARLLRRDRRRVLVDDAVAPLAAGARLRADRALEMDALLVGDVPARPRLPIGAARRPGADHPASASRRLPGARHPGAARALLGRSQGLVVGVAPRRERGRQHRGPAYG